MQFVENDMDDLFRRAAEDYPLKTTGADWDKVMQQLPHTENNLPIVKKNRSNARYLLLLLLLPVPFLCHRYFDGNKLIADIKGTKGNALPQPAENKVQDRFLQNKEEQRSDVNANEQEAISLTKQATVSYPSQKKAGTTISSHSTKEKVASQTSSYSGPDLDYNNLAVATTKKIKTNSNNAAQPGGVQRDNDQAKSADALTVPGQSTESISQPQVRNDTAASTVATVAGQKKKNPAVKTKKLYAGIIGGPDISTVKGDKVDGVGTSIGLLAGYKFSKKLAIEAGILWDTKKYYTDGKNFNTYKTGLPQHTKVIHASSECQMIEIPVSLRYDFASSAKNSFFSTVGVSSYIMKKENYDYVAERYSLVYSSSREYKNSSKDWASIAHLSLGYERSLKNIGNLRIEPYIKLPLKGVGIGSLPLTSTGLYLGITRPIR